VKSTLLYHESTLPFHLLGLFMVARLASIPAFLKLANSACIYRHRPCVFVTAKSSAIHAFIMPKCGTK